MQLRRFLRHLLVGLMTLSVAAFFIATVLVVRSLPKIDGEILAEKLSADVSIVRDVNGVPAITASNRADLAFATGLVHAQDRFFQMDLSRRNAAGELSEIIGAAALPVDRRRRFHRFRDRTARVLAQLDDIEIQILQAYADGVNAGLQSLSARPFEYFLLGVAPELWQPADTILVVYSMYFELNDETARRDIGRGLANRALPSAAFDWLFPNGTRWDAPLTGIVEHSYQVPGPDTFSLESLTMAKIHRDADLLTEAHEPGSNNWAVSGLLTASGRAIVANDMHLGIGVPNVFYRARMRVNSDNGLSVVDLNGLTLPGAPILVAGSNGHIAWGNTNSNGDWTDAVILVPGDEPDSYVTPSGDKRITMAVESIEVKGQAPETLQIRETVWGPILDRGADAEHEIAVSWIAHHVEGVSLGHLQLESSTDVESALQIANTIGMPPQNFVVGDAAGNIGWTIAGRIPSRTEGNSRVPIDWSVTGGWNGWVTPADYPRIVNPESGRIWSANARVVGGDALDVIGDGGYAFGARAQQIRDDLFAIDEFSISDMLSIHLDDRAVFLSRWQKLLLDTLDDKAVAGNERRKRYRDLAKNWSQRAAVDSVGYRLVDEWRAEVRERAIKMVLRPVIDNGGPETNPLVSKHFEQPLWAMVTEKPDHLLTREYADWDELLLASVDGVIADLTDRFGDRLEDRTWGEENTSAIRHPLSPFVPFLSRWLDMPSQPLPGDKNMPRVQFPDFGASERFAVSPGDEAAGYLHMPAGQSGHPLSPFYSAGHDDWVQGRPSAFLPGAAAHTLTLVAQR